MPLFETITDIQENQPKIRKRAYGMIEFIDGNFVSLQLRPWPKLISAVEVAWIGGWKHKRDRKNRCVLYYNQPIAHRNYLVLSYIQSTLGTSYKTLRRTMDMLDVIAQIKQSDALLAEVTYERVPDRLLERWGWERHMTHTRKKHWIKRFYGDYSQIQNQAELNATK